MTATPPADYDVVISGGGMVGASLAWALSALPLRTALFEAVPFASTAQPSFDDRTIALARSSQKILETLDLWTPLREAATPIRRIHVSERGRFGTAVIDAREQGVGELGFVLANRALGAELWRRIATAPQVTVQCPGRVQNVTRAGDALELAVSGPDSRPASVRTRLLVVAEGADSSLRAALGIHATRRPYGQTAIVGNVAVTGPAAPDTAYERFTAQGPAALLPIGDRRFVFVLARAGEQADAVAALPDAAFLSLLQATFGGRVGTFLRVGRRVSYPLSLTRADELLAPRAVLIGNAAHGLHPVAAQGYNLGLRDVAALAEVIADAVHAAAGHADPGDAAVLARYAGWRQRDQRNVVAFTDGLIRLFDLPLASIGRARGLGLFLFDVTPGAKRALARQTMGLAGTLTRLARGLPL